MRDRPQDGAQRRNVAPAQLQFIPANRRVHLWNVFAQDEFALTPDLRLTAGLKAEHTVDTKTTQENARVSA